ncbi:uncharacterized protein I303_103868 [Kwoniella dejecticola CBS 10117]|uniref:Actin cross-linking n=1 Tax=Kwoniella dejecticola CBS 10117 TaxID=1296121 RepID=A0A1A6A7Y6_9TREE|nr:uncharacterized protein I303_03887 [Kwoniella dejecticola CBS 10117]OBR86167.1 hypothetical protein I303_03887 [Kwoniella dejecticola CBS 10117]
MASRFGASKYRNSLLHYPPRDEFYRSHIPSGSTSTSTNSTFSSEIKNNRQWIVTITPAGDLTFRAHKVKDEEEQVGFERVGKGGGVGDWDLSRLEDGTVVIGNSDGSILIYSLPSTPAATLTQRLTIPAQSSSPITHVQLHPTTPDILLASSASHPLTIYDFSSSASGASARITLNVNEPKGLWSTGWSPDGTKLALISKSGNLSIFDPRKSTDALRSKSLVSSLQPLKPCKLAWMGDSIFVTAFSKFRSRQYSLYSSSELETIFTQTLDTSNNPLIPLVDQERSICYVVGKGDMILRQIEISKSFQNGYQESTHSLSSSTLTPMTTPSICLRYGTGLDVMNTEIANILIPSTDKDGDCLVPIGIRVPRKQLIDYHADLFPDILGTVPEQSAEEWLSGQDRQPLPISLDPSSRNVWEDRFKKYKQKTGKSQSALTTLDSPSTENAQYQRPEASVMLAEDSATAAINTKAVAQETPSAAISSSSIASEAPSTGINPDLPPLAQDESYSSTSYKSRIVADYLADEFQKHRDSNLKEPLFVGLQGPQGCGKTTLCSGFVQYLKEKKGLTAAVLSLDDLYKTHEGLKAVAAKHPDNALLSGRGPPGTHDVELAVSILDKVKRINDEAGSSVNLPIFDKSLCGGEGDRSESTIKITGPIDVFILEGWSMGFAPLSQASVKEAYKNPKPASPQTTNTYYTKHPLSSLQTLNTYLEEFARAVHPSFKAFVQVEPLSYDYVFTWRLQQEHAMKSANGGKGMTDDQVQKFVERYMPGYELWKEGIYASGTRWEGRGLKLVFGSEREVLDMIKPTEIPESTKDGVKDVEKGDIQLKKVAQVAKEEEIASENEEIPVRVEVAGENEVTPLPPPPAASAQTPPPPFAAPSTMTSSDRPLQPESANPTVARPPKADTTSVTSKERYNPNWSRKFLAGKSPLIPAYDALPPIQTLHQDSQILKANPQLAFFPIQGTGGRLNVHPLAKKGRLTVGGEGYLSAGVEIVDYAVELAGVRVAVAGEDGVIRVWRVKPEGIQGVGPEAYQVLKGKSIDKITQIAFHPTAKDLLIGLTNDHGSSHLRFWDLSQGEEARVVEISAKGAFNFAISPEGDRVAVATKDNQILVLDPRKSIEVKCGKSHDSPRSFQVAWIDDDHLVSVGFSRGSQRKINLYRITTTDDIETIYSMTIDVSPSVLFPVYDPDTSILYVWGKGERVIQTYEIQLQNISEPIIKLPSYTASSPQIGLTFQPKRLVDVKKVEIAKCLRLTGKTLEEVTFTIPRNKPDFFQDDIYVPTTDVETYIITAKEWLEGKNAVPQKIDLKPEGMIPLSQAPKNDTSRAKKFVPAADVMSEEEKKKQEMDALFAKAKMDESSDEEEPPQKGLPPPDDDW